MTQVSEKYLYVFVRQDISVPEQSVQALHSIYHLAINTRPDPDIPNVVYIGVPDVFALQKVLRKLEDNQITHYCWHEPDNNLGFTAIATEAISGEKRKILSNYRLWKDGRGSGQLDCSFNAGPPTIFPGSSIVEHSDSNLRDAGASPAPGASI